MNRGLTGISFTLHGGGDLQFADIVDDNGRVIPYGVNTLKAFKAKRQLVINVPIEEEELATLIVPYHSVMEYTVMKGFDDISKPADAFCVNRQGGGNNLVGQAVVGTAVVGD